MARNFWEEGLPAWFQTPGMMPQPQPENVLIPETGAGAYWYVDPRAEGQPLYDWPTPNARQSFYDPFSSGFATEPYPAPETLNDLAELFQEMQSMQEEHNRQLMELKQERADPLDRIRHKGMLEPPNADNELAEATGTFELDGIHYVLPTQVGGQKLSPEEAVQRYQETGEHLGAFESDEDARFYETNYLTPQATVQPPQEFNF